MTKKPLVLAGLTASLAACAAQEPMDVGNSAQTPFANSYSEWPDELVGRVLRIEGEEGSANVVNLDPDGTLIVRTEDGQLVADGSWGFRGGSEADKPESGELVGIPSTPASQGMKPWQWLCIDYASRGEECWRYSAPLATNEPTPVVTERGREITLTLLSR